jgi:hypothetical protein
MQGEFEEKGEKMEQEQYYLGQDYSGHNIPLIRYPLEICHGRELEFSPDRAREYAGLDGAIIKRRAPYSHSWMQSDVPLFHPGRVMVTREVMTRLGRMNVLLYLNYHVRGGWADGAYAGEASQYSLAHDGVIWSNYPLTELLWLSVRTSGNRCRTVIRMSHERLAEIRATKRLAVNAEQQDGLEESGDDLDEIPF